MKIFRRKDEEAVSPVIAIILMVAITVVLASVLYVWVMQLADTDTEEAAKFATIEMGLEVGPGGENYLIIDHKSGNPIKWSDFQITIKDVNNKANSATLDDLTGEQKFGETSTITNDTGYAIGNVITSAKLSSISLVSGDQYEVSIYDIAKQQNVLTEKVVAVNV